MFVFIFVFVLQVDLELVYFLGDFFFNFNFIEWLLHLVGQEPTTTTS